MRKTLGVLKRVVLFSPITLALLTACGSTDPAAQRPDNGIDLPVSAVETTTSTLNATGKLDTLSLAGAASSVVFHTDATGQLKVQKLTVVPAIPAVNEVYSSYIMHDVPGKAALGAWRVVTDVHDLKGPASLKLDRPAQLQTQATTPTTTEVFVKDNRTGTIDVVGTFPESSNLVLDDFGDLINERRRKDLSAASVDLTYFAYSAPTKDYQATCVSEGGEIVQPQEYCSFANKRLSASMRASSIRPQALSNMRIVSWNLGNVAQSCSTATAGANYNYKLCYVQTERRISDQILAFEQTKKPDVIFFQEIWHGDCRYTPESWYGTYVNQRLCASNVPGNDQNTLNRILGWRYYTHCTPTEDIPADNLVVNGYECVAINPDTLQANWNQPYSPGGFPYDSLHPSCTSNPDINHNYLGRDTGYAYYNAVPINSTNGPNIILVTGHLAGINLTDCRMAQLNELRNKAPFNSSPYALFAGDWNTDPNASGDPASSTMRSVFAGAWGAPTGNIGTEIDDPTQPTAFYANGNQNLDHVFGRGFTGQCTRGPNFDGTDHTFTDCTVSAATY